MCRRVCTSINKWTVKNTVTALSKKMIKYIYRIAILILIFVIVMYSLGLYASYVNKMRLESELFDKEIWLNRAGSQECVRGEMMSDLETKHFSDDMTLDQILSLLGKPDREFSDRSNRWIFEYEIGDCLFFGNSTGGSLSFEIHRESLKVIDRTLFQK